MNAIRNNSLHSDSEYSYNSASHNFIPELALNNSLRNSLRNSFGTRLEAKFPKVRRIRNICRTLVSSIVFQVIFVVLISINAILMGVSTYYYENEEITKRFNFVDQIFLVVFTIELIIHFIALLFHFFADGWLVFDFSIIILSWLFERTQIMRAFRTFRALRLITRVKTLKYLVEALLGVLVRAESIMLLLLIIMYIFSVMLTELLKDSSDDAAKEFFGNLYRSLFTLFRMMTFDEWGVVAREIMAVYTWSWLPIIIYVVFSGILIMNLIIAVLYDALRNNGKSSKDKLYGKYDDNNIEKYIRMGLVSERMKEIQEHIDALEQLQTQYINFIESLARKRHERLRRNSMMAGHEEEVLEYNQIQIIIPPKREQKKKQEKFLHIEGIKINERINTDLW